MEEVKNISNVKEYLLQVNDLMKNVYKGRMTVEQYLLDNGTECKITCIKDLPKDIRKELERAIQVMEPQIKECYKNAVLLTACLPEAEYWEGFSAGIIPVNHAWNRYKGYFIDITWEQLKHGIGQDYIGVCIPSKKAMKLSMKKIAFLCSPLYQLVNTLNDKAIQK